MVAETEWWIKEFQELEMHANSLTVVRLVTR